MNGRSIGRDQRDYISFGRSNSSASFQKKSYDQTDGSFTGTDYSGNWSNDPRSEAFTENHSGKGPKGYERSRDRIYEEACELLTHCDELDASKIEVDVEGTILILKGEVSSRHDKRLAEDLVEDIAGISDVFNRLSVNKDIEGWIPGVEEVRNKSHSGGSHE